MAHYQPEGDGSPVQSTQPFSDRDESYQARLATAVGFYERLTQTFDIKDPAYRARLRSALGCQSISYSYSMPRPEEVHRPLKDRSPGNQLAKSKTTYKYP